MLCVSISLYNTIPPLYWEETDTQRCQGTLTQVPLSLWQVNDQNPGDLTPSGHILFLLPILLSVHWEGGVPKNTQKSKKQQNQQPVEGSDPE